MPDWLQVAVVVAVVIAAAVLVTRRMDDVWAGLRQRVAESPDTVDDAISDAIDVLDGWPTELPRRVPTGAHDLLDLEPAARAQQIAALEALHDMPSYIRPPVSPGRDQ